MTVTPPRTSGDDEGDRTDAMFVKFTKGMFLVLILYGAGMMAAIFWANPAFAIRLISGFASMFTGVLGFGAGYLLGRRYGSTRTNGD
jgi:hypothetical protein